MRAAALLPPWGAVLALVVVGWWRWHRCQAQHVLLLCAAGTPGYHPGPLQPCCFYWLLQVAGLWVLLAIAVAAGILLAALPHVTYAAADAWAARRARRSLAASPDIAVWSSKSSAGWNQASNASLKASSSSIQSMRLPSSGSLKVAASQGDASGAAACTQVDPPPPHPLRAASLRHVGVHAAEEAAQQAVPEPAAFLNPDAGEAAAADEDEDERLAALLEAQRAVEQAVGMLQEQLLRRRR